MKRARRGNKETHKTGLCRIRRQEEVGCDRGRSRQMTAELWGEDTEEDGKLRMPCGECPESRESPTL